MEITSPNLETSNQLNQDAVRRNTSLVKFEMVKYNANPPPPPPKRSLIGGFFKAIRAFSPLGFLFPGVGTAVGLAGLGLGGIGDSMDNKKIAKQVAQNTPPPPMPAVYPGLSSSTMNDPIMNVVYRHDDTLMSQRME